MINSFEPESREQVLSATWTPLGLVEIVSSDLPDAWLNALARLGRDLCVRQYGGSIEHVDWIAEYEASTGGVLLLSNVTVTGRGPGGLGIDGAVPQVDDDEESILACIADLVQDQVARAHVAWPWGDSGGFMSPRHDGSHAVWFDKGRRTVVGTL